MQWLGRWWFLGAVFLLALNDHVLKARFGNWWTGKLSDVVGPVVVATLIAIPLGRILGVVVTAVGFTALKTIPGVAEAAAPILGGTTLRDVTDLIGLLALIPTWLLLVDPRSGDVATHRHHSHVAATAQPKIRRALHAVGLVAAVLVTSATSYDDPPEVERILSEAGNLYAAVRHHSHDQTREPVDWFASHDGGLSWNAVSAPPDDAQPSSSDEVCRSDGWCFRSGGSRIEEQPPAGPWRTSYELTWDQRNLFAYRSRSAEPRYEQLVAVPTNRGEHVVAAAREEGVLVLDGEGRWHRRGVGLARPTDLSGTFVPFWVGQWMIPISAVVALILIPAAALRRRRVVRGTKLMVGVSALLISVGLWLGAAFSWVIGTLNVLPPVAIGVHLIVMSVLVVAVPLVFIRLIGGPVQKGPHCISEPHSPPPKA